MTESSDYPTPYGERPFDRELAANLFEPGWAGHLRPIEVRFIREVLQKKQPLPNGLRRGKLRNWWGLTGQGVASEAAIRHVDMWGDPDDILLNRCLVREAKASGPAEFRVEAPVARAAAK